MEGSPENLRALFAKADKLDLDDGKRAYLRYRDVLRDMADYWDFPGPVERVVGAFCALSPNNDYKGNLRSLASMLEAFKLGVGYDKATVSTYKHCAVRAALYLCGTPFLEHAKGPKIRAFYQNIVDPTAWEPVTVDGHIVCAWAGRDMVMTEAAVGAKVYREIAQHIRWLAQEHCMLPNQMQAVLWFTRKRIKGVKYDPQLDLLATLGGAQKTVFHPSEILPYGAAA